MADQKKPASTNGEFKTSPLGFDKNDRNDKSESGIFIVLNVTIVTDRHI